VYGTSEAPNVETEQRSIGSVTWRLYAKYLGAGNGPYALALLILFLVGGHILLYACDFFLVVL